MKFSEININLTDKIKGGALLSTSREDGYANTMTVSWGGTGVIWGREVCFVFVRESRHTYPIMENSEIYTLSFLDGEKRSLLSYCGTKSGRDVDKFKACDLDYSIENGAVVLKDSKMTLVLKKLYSQMIEKTCFYDEKMLDFYKDNDYHKMYICEITDVIIK